MHCELHKVVLNKDSKPSAKFPIYNGFNLLECYSNVKEHLDKLDGPEALLIEILDEDTVERIQPSYIKSIEDFEYAKEYIKEQLKSYPFIRVSTICTIYSDFVFHVEAYDNGENINDHNEKNTDRFHKAMNYAIELLKDDDDGFNPDEFTTIEVRDYIGNTLIVRGIDIESKDLKTLTNKK